MDPLSAIASVIAVYQLASKVGELCFLYVKGVRGARKESDLVIDEISRFQKSLLTLKRMLADEDHTQGGGDRLKNLKELMDGDSASLEQCKRDLEKLRTKLENSKMRDGIRAIVHKLSWPLKEEEVSKVTERLRDVAAAIDRALNMDNTEMLRSVDATAKRLEISFENFEGKHIMEEEQKNEEETRGKILMWLEHPRPEENHHVACRARNDMAKTGRWFLDGDTFKKFKDTPCSLLWLHGESGCGKTVLASAIIEDLQALQGGDTRVGVAYWYYSANVKKRTILNNLVRALVTQFIPESSVPTVVDNFWKAKKKGDETPKTSELVQLLQNIIVGRGDQPSYIVIDALDESDDAEREEFMDMLQRILATENSVLHILVTGRTNTSRVQKEWQDPIRFDNIVIEREDVHSDILSHITERLQNDKVLKTWPEKERQKIKSSLVEKAAGMFRLVDCQLQAISKCKKPADLNKTLNTLPKDLHQQYARELAGIADTSSQDALKILQCLTFPQRKLRLEEIIDIIAVDLDREPPVFDEDNRLWNPDGIQEICGSLVRVDLKSDGCDSIGEPQEIRTLTTAHATVLDFLMTQPIKISSEPEVRFTKSTINLRMAETCLVYLRYFMDNGIELTKDSTKLYPLARFCAEFWDDHYREIIANDKEKVNMTRINEMVMALFHSPEAMLNWIRLCNPQDETLSKGFDTELSDIHTPIYYAAMLGLPDIVIRLVDEGAKINDTFADGYGTPLVAASFLGRRDVVSLLLEKGADPNLSGYWLWGCPLASAVEQNLTEIVKILLNREDVDINCRRVPFHNKITETTEESDNVWQTHMSRQSMVYIAAAYGSSEVLEVLLEAGADPNIEGGACKTALQAACKYQQESLVRILLDSGVDPNIQECGDCDNALQQACSDGKDDVVRLLLERGADPNLYGGRFGGTFQAGCFSGKEQIVRLLLEKGADTKYRGGAFGTPLLAAIENGSETVVKFLLENGAQLEERSISGQSPLCKAICGSHSKIVNHLIDLGAHTNSKDKRGCSYLHYAARACHGDILTKILSFGPDINDLDSNGWSPLHWAASSGNGSMKAIKILLKAGSNKDLEDKQGRTAIDLAELCGKSQEVRILKTDASAYDNLPETNDEEGLPLVQCLCDICKSLIRPRKSVYADRWYHCKTCFELDLCSRCVLDKDVLHPKDHEFTTQILDHNGEWTSEEE